jgi:hypothetical protein
MTVRAENFGVFFAFVSLFEAEYLSGKGRCFSLAGEPRRVTMVERYGPDISLRAAAAHPTPLRTIVLPRVCS